MIGPEGVSAVGSDGCGAGPEPTVREPGRWRCGNRAADWTEGLDWASEAGLVGHGRLGRGIARRGDVHFGDVHDTQDMAGTTGLNQQPKVVTGR